jgi:AcrR family transcriptional regulator
MSRAGGIPVVHGGEDVNRVTVYRHFPDETALFNACSAHWMSQQRPPEPGAWEQIGDPVQRLRAGLADLYRYYRAGAGMLTHIYHDFAALPEAHQRLLRDLDNRHGQILAAPFPSEAGQRRSLRAIIGHAVSFWTWHSLCLGQGLTDQEAVQVMTGAVLAVTAPPVTGPAQRPPRNPADPAPPGRAAD